MSTLPASTITVKLAVAAYHSSTFWNDDIRKAGGAVRLVVLEESFGRIDLNNATLLNKTVDWIKNMRAAGQLVFGYIACKSGESDPATVSVGVKDASGNLIASGIDTWYQRYPLLDGIYIDEGPLYDKYYKSPLNGKTIQDNYISYGQAIRRIAVMDGTTQRNWRVMMEAANYPDDWILSVAEFILLWEGKVAQYNGILQAGYQGLNSYTNAPSWWFNVPDLGTTKGQERIVHTIFEYTPSPPSSGQKTIDAIKAFLAKVRGYNAGSVYLTNDPKPGKLASYWKDEVTAV